MSWKWGVFRQLLDVMKDLLSSCCCVRMIIRHSLKVHRRCLLTRSVGAIGELALASAEFIEAAGEFIWCRSWLRRRRCAEPAEILCVYHESGSENPSQERVAIPTRVEHLEQSDKERFCGRIENISLFQPSVQM